MAVFTKNRTNAAYEGARLGADRVAARMGGRAIHYVPDTPDDVAQQAALVDRALGENAADRPDAFVFVPVHLTAMNESILRINAAGIPLVNLISPTGVGERVCFVGSDDCALAMEVTRYVALRLRPGARVVILEGHPASGTTGERLRGIRAALADLPGLAVAASVRGDYQRDIACDALSALLRQGVRFDAVIASNDTMALGALDALEALRPGEPLPPVAGVNAIPEAVSAIRAGRLLATVDFDAMKMACIATEAAFRHLRGEAVPSKIMLPVQVVDASNCAQWDLPYAARACPDWDEVMRCQQ
ncbi:MAG: sugar ABC transporter substrate-binding protein [Proteobacteria bacterium]|nr:sugar ABC transporter substrate-binding protein [Pseudomonadota bacterium]